jgi:hypothetical protein
MGARAFPQYVVIDQPITSDSFPSGTSRAGQINASLSSPRLFHGVSEDGIT